MTLCPHCHGKNVEPTLQRGIDGCPDCGAEFRDDYVFKDGTYRTFMENVLNKIASELSPNAASAVINLRDHVLDEKDDVQDVVQSLMDITEGVNTSNVLGIDREAEVTTIVEGIEKIMSYARAMAGREEISERTVYRLSLLEGVSSPDEWLNPPGEIPDLPGEISDEPPPSASDIIAADQATPPELVAQQDAASEVPWNEATWLGEKVQFKVEECGGTVKYNVKGAQGPLISYNEETGSHDGIENFTEEQLAELDSVIAEFNKGVMDSMKDQYGADKAKEVYYATANKQGRNPENFKKDGTVESTETVDPVAQAEALSKPMMASEGVASTVDQDAADELALYIDNDADLYRQQHTPIINNLLKKMKKGVYDHDKAAKLFEYLTIAGAKKYIKEFGGDISMFSKATRRAAAEKLRDQFEAEHLPDHPIDETGAEGVYDGEKTFDDKVGHIAPDEQDEVADAAEAFLYNNKGDLEGVTTEEIAEFLATHFPNLVGRENEVSVAIDDKAIEMGNDNEHDQFNSDAEADADVLASAGMGTDEDYGSAGDMDEQTGDSMTNNVNGPIGSPNVPPEPAVDGPLGQPVVEDDEEVLAQPIEDEEHEEAEAAAMEVVQTKAEKAQAKIESAEEALESLKAAVEELVKIEDEEGEGEEAGEGEGEEAGEEAGEADEAGEEVTGELESEPEGEPEGEAEVEPEGEPEEPEKIEELAKKKVGKHDYVAKPERVPTKCEETGKAPTGHVVKYVSGVRDTSKEPAEQWEEKEVKIPLTQALVDSEKSEVDEEGKKKESAGKKRNEDSYDEKDFKKGKPGSPDKVVKVEEMTRFNGYRLGDKIKVLGHPRVLELTRIYGSPVRFALTEGSVTITVDPLNDQIELDGDADLKWQRTASIIEDTRAVWEDMEKELVKEGCSGGVCTLGGPMTALNSTSGIGNVASAAPVFVKTPIHVFGKEITPNEVYAYIKNNNLHNAPRESAISHVLGNFQNPSLDIEKIYDDAVLSLKADCERLNEVDSSYGYETQSSRSVDVQQSLNEGYDKLKEMGIV